MTGNEDDFVGEFETKRASDGYGLVMDKGSAEKQEMARTFNDEVEVGAPMAEPEIETADLPEATGGIYDEVAPGSEADKAMSAEVSTADSLGEGETVVSAAAPVVSSPVTTPEVKGEALPAAEADKGMSFGEAFKKYRAAGKKAFDWNGKSFTTALKSEKAKPLPKAAPVAKPAEKPTPQAIAVEVFKLQDEPAKSAALTKPSGNPAVHQNTATTASAATYHEQKQKAYDDWMAAKSRNTTWYGGKAQGTPTSKQAEIEAERRYTELLRNPGQGARGG